MPNKLAMTSISFGRCFAGHSFVHKLDMARAHGYMGLELFHEDLADVAERLPGGLTRANELEAAHIIRKMCADRGIEILCLQPFWHYEGLVDRAAHDAHIDKLQFWFKLCRALRTDLIQIPSNFLPEDQLASPESGIAVCDLRKVADMGLTQSPPIRFVYEALCWGTQVDTWEASWEMVKAVDRPNFGLLLDTFNIAGRIYADPAAASGRTRDCDRVLAESAARIVEQVDVDKLFYVQVVDAERLAEPISDSHPFHAEGQKPRMSWSRNCRLFYGEADRGAYLPVRQVAEAIFKGLGYQGWVSMELFNRRMSERDPEVPRELAARGAASYQRLATDMGFAVESRPRDVGEEWRRIPALF